MSREKRIKEIETIAKTLCADFQTEKCYECPANKHCEVGLDSCVIYDAGYRKQNEKYLVKENGDIEPLNKQSEYVTDIHVGNKSEWISVDERLPNEKVNCLVHYKHAYADNDGYWAIGVSFYDGCEFRIGLAYKVTHWMPLPEPPKMKGDSHTEQWTFTILGDNGLPESFTKTVKKGGAEE